MDVAGDLLETLDGRRRRKQGIGLRALRGVESLDVRLGLGRVVGDLVARLGLGLGVLRDLALLALGLDQGGGLGHLVGALHHEADDVGEREADRHFDPAGGALLFEKVKRERDAARDVGGAEAHAGGLGGDAEAAGGVVDGAFNDAGDDCDLRIGG